MKYLIKPLIAGAAIIAATSLGVRGCNMAFNNRTITTPAYKSVNYATGISGHVEYTRYSDDAQDVKVYSGLGHRLFESKLHQDLDGDGKVDIIRHNGSEWKLHRLTELLVREYDYQTHKSRFDKADSQLQMLMTKYPK